MSERTRLQIRVLDVFTDKPLTGNPLGVVLGAEGLSDGQMQAIAREFNLSETTFVLPATKPEADYRIRIFTPARELPFAGHPSVGTAFLLAEEGLLQLWGPSTEADQEVQIGVLPLEILSEEGRPVRVIMTQGAPELGEQYKDTEVAKLAGALGLTDEDVRDDLPVQVSSTGIQSLMLPLNTLEALGKIRLDARALRDVRGLEPLSGIYAWVSAGDQVRARFFAPDLGISEDPATGSAAGALGAYLYSHNGIKRTGDTLRFVINQGVEMGRPSRIEVEVAGEGNTPKRVRVGGAAVTVSRGELLI